MRMLAESKRPGLARATRACALLAAVAGVLLAPACRRDSRLAFPGAPVILISVDTLRADHLPAYGYRAVETPNLDALRKDGILYENAYAQVPLTLPSHAAIFTGLLPPQNGVRDNLGYALGPKPATLAAFLAEQGYATGGAVSSIVLSHATGISRGFEFYEDAVEPTKVNQTLSRVQRRGNETAAFLQEWIGGRGGKPFLAFLHLFEPHSPYEPPEPFLSRYALPYDGEIARSDEIVGGFLKFLKDRGLYDRAIVIFLSDHGEGLGDHGEDEHGVLLYREAIRVPLIVKLPGGRHAGATVKGPVALTDVFPTVAALAGFAIPPGLAGRPLTEGLPGAPPASAGPPRRIYSETLYPRLHLGWSDLASLVDDRNHYIESPRPELYDLVADPGEKTDLSGELPPAFRTLRAELSRLPRPLQVPGSSDPEQMKRLAALGYISASSADLEKRDLPAPRDRIGAVAKLRLGFSALQAGRDEEAVKVLGALLETEPGMTDVWQMYSEACMKLGRDAEALRALQTAAKLAPGNPQILMALSDYYVQTGNFEEARKHAEAVGDAGTVNPHEALARIALAEGDLASAEREARAALAKYPTRRVPRLILGRVLHDRRDYAGALVELEQVRLPRAEEDVVLLQNLNFLRGDSLARLGREAEAEAAFREEIRDFPGNPAPRAALAMLYASQGRETEARKALGDLVLEVHTAEAYFAAIRTFEILGDPGAARELKADLQRRFPEAKERRG